MIASTALYIRYALRSLAPELQFAYEWCHANTEHFNALTLDFHSNFHFDRTPLYRNIELFSGSYTNTIYPIHGINQIIVMLSSPPSPEPNHQTTHSITASYSLIVARVGKLDTNYNVFVIYRMCAKDVEHEWDHVFTDKCVCARIRNGRQEFGNESGDGNPAGGRMEDMHVASNALRSSNKAMRARTEYNYIDKKLSCPS